MKIDAHVNSFPIQTSHYANNIIKYLDERLDCKTLSEMYNAKHPENKVGYTFFYTYFKNNFNRRFGQPHVDCCCECEKLNVTISNSHISNAARQQATVKLKDHQKRHKITIPNRRQLL